MERNGFRLFAILFLLAALLWIAVGASAAPQVFSPEPEYDFKTAMEGDSIKHNYIIQNKGDEALQITNVRSSCGCTAVTPAEKIIQPGGQTSVEVIFNTAGRVGKQSKYIYVQTNDPTSNVLKLTISGDVQKMPAPEVAVRPYSWNLQNLKIGETRSTTAYVMNLGDQPLEVIAIKPTRPGIQAKLLGPSTIAPGGRVNMEIHFSPDPQTSIIRDQISIETNDPKRKTYSFLIYGRIDFEASGLAVSVIGSHPGPETTTVDLHFHNKQNTPINVTIPDSAEPNKATVPPNAMRKFSAKVPTSKMNETQMSDPAGDIMGLLKLEISLPIKLTSKTPQAKSDAMATTGTLQPPPPPPPALVPPADAQAQTE